jgi:hypothetical protein
VNALSKTSILASLLLCTSVQSAPPDPAAARMIGELAHYTTFRKSNSEIHAHVSKYCVLLANHANASGTDSEYECPGKSSIKSIRLITSDNAPEHYVRTLKITFAKKDVGTVIQLAKKQLGKPKARGRDFISWAYHGDPALLTHGTPYISVVHDRVDSLAFFSLGLSGSR